MDTLNYDSEFLERHANQIICMPNVSCDLQYAKNPERRDTSGDIVPWYIPRNYFKNPDPKTLNHFILNKIVYVIDPDERSYDFLYGLIKDGIRIFLLQLKVTSPYCCWLILETIKKAASVYKTEIDENFVISIGYEMIGRNCCVGHLRNGQPIVVKPNCRVNITCDRRYTNNSTLANLFINCHEHIVEMLRKGFRKGEFIILDDVLFLEIMDIENTTIWCKARNRVDFELNSYVSADFPIILDSQPIIQENEDADIIKLLKGDFVLVSGVDDIRYYEKIASLFSSIDIPIYGNYDFNLLRQDSAVAIKHTFDGFFVSTIDKHINVIKSSIEVNKPVTIHVDCLNVNCSKHKIQNDEIISRIVNDVDCIMITKREHINDILSIHAIDISDYDRPAYMNCEIDANLTPTEFIMGTVAVASHVINANLIICTTKCGKTIKKLIKQRLNCCIIAITTSSKTARRLLMYRGVLGLVWLRTGKQNWNREIESILNFGLNYARKHNFVEPNQTALYIYHSDPTIGYANNFRLVKT